MDIKLDGLLDDIFKNKDMIRKYLPILKVLVTDVKTKAMLAGVECALIEYDNLCASGDC